jgi:hypothetical protein
VADRADEAHIVEAPAMIHHGNRYVLFYSGNAFNSGRYFINYATTTALDRRFKQHRGQLLNSATVHRIYRNPGGADVLRAPHDDFLVFHAYTSATVRSLFAVGLRWDHHDHPVLSLGTRHAFVRASLERKAPRPLALLPPGATSVSAPGMVTPGNLLGDRRQPRGRESVRIINSACG